LFRALVNAIPVTTFALDGSLGLIRVKGEDLASIGLSPDTPAGTHMAGMPGMPAAIVDLLRRALAGAPTSEDLTLPSGVPVSLHLAPIRDRDGRITGVAGVARDVARRHLAERALAESERRFRRLAEGSYDTIVEIGRDSTYTYVSPNMLDALGYTPEELIGTSALALIHTDDAAGVMERFTQAIGSGGSGHAVYRCRHKNGEWRWFESAGNGFVDADGVQGLIAASRDVTDRKRADEALRANEQRYRLLAENTFDLISEVREDGTIAYITPNCLSMLGYTSSELIGRPVFEFVDPDDLPRVVAAFQDGLAAGASRGVSFRYRKSDGTVCWLESTGNLITDAAGERRAILVSRDVSDRLRAEQSLRESEELFRTTLESTDDGVLVTDADGAILYYSQRFVEIFQIPREVMESDDRQAVRTYVAERVEDGEEFLLRLQELYATAADGFDVLRFRDGPVFERNSRVLLYADGSVRGRVWSFRNITDRRRLEEQFAQAQKMESVGRLAGGVAHDVNNLMTAIIGYADLGARGLPEDSELRSDLGEIRATAERAAKMAHQLLAFSRREMLAPRLTDLNELLGNTQRMLRHLIGEDVEMIVSTAAGLWPVRVDPSQFEQVIVNLAVNARDAMPDGGRLTLETSNVVLLTEHPARPGLAAGEYVLLTVADTGEGMTDEVKQHIFEPFFTTKAAGKGTGLGLATCYGMVHQATGNIYVESAAGKGAVFLIYLPRANGGAGASEAAPQDQPSLPRGTETVLLAEDEPLVRRLAARVLRGAGYHVIEAEDGAAALRIAAVHEGPLDLLLTDAIMPNMGGHELAERMRAQHPGTRVLLMSAYTDRAIVQESESAGRIAFLRKPFTPGDLARKVRAVLDTPPAN
jgi:PAS domain S-box-containing protein